MKREWIQRVTAWILLVVMGVNCFGSSIPAGKAYATDYEKASEEAENEIKAAEEAANEGKSEGTTTLKEETDQTEAVEEKSEADLEESLDSKIEAEEDSELYESMTITSATTLTEDMEVGDLTVSNELHLNGHKLTVHGNVELNFYLYMEEGYLVVEGDFNAAYYAQIFMDSANDSMDIAGSYIYAETYSKSQTIKKGTIKIGGDIYGKDDNYCNTSFVFEDACKVILYGNKEQTLDIRTDSNLQIQNLIIENTSEEGVFSKHMLSGSKITDKDGKLHYKVEGEFGETLAEDKVIEGDYCLLGGVLDLAGHSLTIQGDFIHAGGEVDIKNGTLIIEGDYRKQFVYQEDGEEIAEHSAGRLFMQNKKDYVLIKGSYIDSGVHSTESDLTAGTLELQGSILADDSLKHPLFQATGTHITKLTGSGEQIIQNGASYTKDSICFSNLQIAQPETGSVVLDSPIAVTGSVAHESNHVTGTTQLAGADIQSTDLYGNIQLLSAHAFSSDLTVHGDLYSKGAGNKNPNGITVNNSHLTVEGNYYHEYTSFTFTGENAVFSIKGDFIIQNSGASFESGTIEIAGDLKKSGNGYLSCGSGAEVCFNGTKEQNLSVASVNSLLTNVVVDNPAGVVVEDNIMVVNVACRQGVLSYASGAVHGFTVEEDGEYEGDLVIGGGIFDLNGHSYHIKGNLTIANGALNMTHAEDSLIVDGDFKTTTNMEHNGRLTAGTMEIKGDFTQAGNAASFSATDNHTTIFSGAEAQTITFSDINNSCFKNVKFYNEKGVSLPKEARVNGTVEQKGPVDGYLRIGSGVSFEASEFCGNIRVIEELTLSKDMKIDGNLNIERPLSLDGHTLEVTQKVNVSYEYGCIYFQHGHMICKDFSTNTPNGLSMQNGDDLLTVLGNFDSSAWFKNSYTGTIAVGGDVQFSGGWGEALNEDAIFELNGTQKQTIAMEGNGRYLGTLVLNNSSEDGIYVTNILNYKKLDNPAGIKVTFADGGTLGYTLQEDEVVEGDLFLSGGDMDLNGYSLTIKGDLIQNSGNLFVNGGELTVEGDYCLARRTEGEDGTYSYETSSAHLYMEDAEDTITVKGSIHTAVQTGYMNCTAGTLNLNGNLSIYGYTAFVLGSNANFVLTGARQQEFTPGDYLFQVGNMDIRNEKGVKFTNENAIIVRGNLRTNGNPVEGWINIGTGAVIEDSIKGNINFFETYPLDKDVLVDGNVILNSVDLNGHHLTVNENCTISTYSYKNNEQEDGILEVKGNLIYRGSYESYKGTGTNQLILSGDEKQVIPANGQYWQFHEIVIANTSEW